MSQLDRYLGITRELPDHLDENAKYQLDFQIIDHHIVGASILFRSDRQTRSGGWSQYLNTQIANLLRYL